MTATGSSSLRCAMNARAAAIAASIGSPAMLFDASIEQDRAARLRAAVDREPGDGAAVLRDVEAVQLRCGRRAYSQTRSGTRSPAPR